MEYDKEKVSLPKQVRVTIERLILMRLSQLFFLFLAILPFYGLDEQSFCKVSLLLKWDKIFLLPFLVTHFFPTTAIRPLHHVRSLALTAFVFLPLPSSSRGLTPGHHQLLNQFST